jgi:nucleolin
MAELDDKPHNEEKEDSPAAVATETTTDEADEAAATSKRRRKRKRKKASAADEEETEEEAAAAEAPVLNSADASKASEVDRTVFLEGIPFTCSVDQVRAFFEEQMPAGSEVVDLRLPVWHDSGRLRGYGHAVFATVEQKEAALKLSGKYLQKRYLTIQPAQAPKAVPVTVVDHGQATRTIALHNLSYEATEKDLTKACEPYGALAAGGVRVVRHSDTGRSKGFAYVEFVEQSSATAAVKGRVVVCGRQCRLDYDHGRVRGSFRTADRSLWHKEYGGGGSHGKAPTHGAEE